MNLKTILIAVGTAAAASAASAAIDVGGNAELTATLNNSPQTAIAGANSTARNDVNTVEGNVKIGGDLKMTATLKNSPQTAIAGANATAENRVNALRGK